jgi:hypothetical protein
MLDACTTRLTTWADRICFKYGMQARGVSHWLIRVYELIGRGVAVSAVYPWRLFCKASPGAIYLHGYLQGKNHRDSWYGIEDVEVCENLSLI